MKNWPVHSLNTSVLHETVNFYGELLKLSAIKHQDTRLNKTKMSFLSLFLSFSFFLIKIYQDILNLLSSKPNSRYILPESDDLYNHTLLRNIAGRLFLSKTQA